MTTKFSGFSDYWEPFLLGQEPAGAYVRGLSGTRRESLRNAVKSRLAVQDESEAISLSAKVWAICGSAPKPA